jgi:hypothetical protein
MSNIIVDGSGSGYAAKVDQENKLLTHSFTVSSALTGALKGDAFNVGSTLLTLTSANESACLYIKNLEQDDIIISVQFINLGASTGGSGESKFKFYLNPTTGTIIDNAVAGDAFNRKIGSSNTLSATVYKGAEGYTLTNGDVIEAPTTGLFSTVPFVLEKGSAFGIAITPPTGNTSLEVQIGLNVIKNGSSYGNNGK